MFRKKRHIEQVRQELQRAPKRIEWRFRQLLNLIGNILGVWMLFGSVLILPWLAGHPGFEAASQRFIGWPFWASWLVFVILLPSAWFAVTTRVFSEWWDEGGVTMANDAAYKQHAEQLNEWRREDTADDERWQQRADTAGSLALAGTVGEGHMAIAVDEEDQLPAPTVTDAES